MKPMPNPRNDAGFTLAEMVVTLLIVALLLVISVQGIQRTMSQSAYTRDSRIARELALLQLGRLEAGLYMDEIEDHMEGDFSDDDQPYFAWELVLGTEEFYDEDVEESDRFDSWEDYDEDEDEEADSGEPWVVARVKVTFPQHPERTNELILERWLTREFVYGPEDEDDS